MKTILKILILFIFFNGQLIQGQSSFIEGYILKTFSDTLKGKIEVKSENFMARKCRFLDKNTNKITIFYPNDIAGYMVGNSNFYVSKEIGKQKVFLQYLVKGKLNAFFIRDKNGDHYYVENDSISLSELTYKEGITSENNKTYKFRTTEHLKTLQLFTKDAPLVQMELSKMKEPNHDNLTEIASKYHYEVCKDSLCIVYKRNKLNTKPIFTFNTGLVIYNKYLEEFAGILRPSFGINIEKPFERVNTNLSIKTGINYDFINDFNASVIRKIPVQIIFNKPLKTVTPNLGFGINLIKIKYKNDINDNFFSFLINLGITKFISNNIGISLNYELEYLPKNYFPIYDKTLSNSLKLGFRFRLKQ